MSDSQTQTERKHTPLPWWVRDPRMISHKFGHICEVWKPDKYSGGGTQEANADFIALAVNSHYKLVEAARVALYNSRRRSEGRGKWTCGDQKAHEALVAALADATPAQEQTEPATP